MIFKTPINKVFVLIFLSYLSLSCDSTSKTSPSSESTFSLLELEQSTGSLSASAQTYSDNIPYASLESIGQTDGSNLNGIRTSIISAVGDITVTLSGGDVTVRPFMPAANTSNSLPMVIYIHGGGFILGSFEGNPIPQKLADSLQAKVFAVEYRLAPENPYPAAVNDVLEVTQWLINNAVTYNADPKKVVLAGDSAGANLALVTAMQLRDLGNSQIDGIVALYPNVDFTIKTSGSWVDFGSYKTLLSSDANWIYDLYAGLNLTRSDPLGSPLLGSFEDFPATFVVTAEFDLLRDEGEELCIKIFQSGSTIRCYRHNGMPHGYLSYASLETLHWNLLYQTISDMKSIFWN